MDPNSRQYPDRGPELGNFRQREPDVDQHSGQEATKCAHVRRDRVLRAKCLFDVSAGRIHSRIPAIRLSIMQWLQTLKFVGVDSPESSV